MFLLPLLVLNDTNELDAAARGRGLLDRVHPGHRAHPGLHRALDGPGARVLPRRRAAHRRRAVGGGQGLSAAGPNPVLPGCTPTRSVCRVGGDLYLVASSFEYFPGIPIFHGRDVWSWRPLGHALDRRSQLTSPACRARAGSTRRRCATTTGPSISSRRWPGGAASWCGRRTRAGRGPTRPGSTRRASTRRWRSSTAAMLYTRNGPGSDPDHPFIYQAELRGLETGRPRSAGAPRVIWRGTGGIWPEAPHLFRRGGWLVPAHRGGRHELRALGRGRPGARPLRAVRAVPARPAADPPRRPRATRCRRRARRPGGARGRLLAGRAARDADRRRPPPALGRETFAVELDWGDDGWPRIARHRIPLGPGPRFRAGGVSRRRVDMFGGGSRSRMVFLRDPDPLSWSVADGWWFAPPRQLGDAR